MIEKENNLFRNVWIVRMIEWMCDLEGDSVNEIKWKRMSEKLLGTYNCWVVGFETETLQRSSLYSAEYIVLVIGIALYMTLSIWAFKII